MTTSFAETMKKGLGLILAWVVVLVVVIALYSAKKLILLFIVAIGIGAVLAPVFRKLKKKYRVPYGLTAFSFLALFAIAFIGGTIAISSLVVNELIPLSGKLPEIAENLTPKILDLLEPVPTLQNLFREARVDVKSYLPRITESAWSGAKWGGAALFHFLFVFAVAIYVAVDGTRYYEGFLALFPRTQRDSVSYYLSEVGDTLRNWIFAQAIVMACVGGLTALFLVLIGMDNWLTFGIMAGLMDIVPYVGPFLSGGILTLVALLTEPSRAIWVFLAFVVIQQLEGYVITPLVMRGQVELPPIYLLVLIFLMGQWFGLVGVFAAPPLLAVIHRLFMLWYVPKMNNYRA